MTANAKSSTTRRKQSSKKRPAVLDLTKIDREQDEAARALVSLLNSPGLPAFITSGVRMMLAHAAAVKGADITTEAGAYDLKSLSVLFAVASGLQPDLEFEPARDFAELLSAALRHADCPTELYNAIADLNCMTLERWDTPEYIRLSIGQPSRGKVAPRSHRDETDEDAEAIARIIQSPRVPASVRNALGQAIDPLVDEYRDEQPELIAAALRAATAAKEGGGRQ